MDMHKIAYLFYKMYCPPSKEAQFIPPGVSLFLLSLTLSHNNVTFMSAKFGDTFTFILQKFLPLSFQNWFRSTGFLQFLNDFAAYALGIKLALTDLRAMFTMYELSNKLSSVQYGNTSRHKLEIFSPISEVSTRAQDSEGYQKKKRIVPGRVLAFVHGGAWGCGQLWQYRLIANGIGSVLGAEKVVLIGYPTYPVSTIVEQRDCITSAIHAIQTDERIQKLLNPQNDQMWNDVNAGRSRSTSLPKSNKGIILCGHSSGANICALSLLQQFSAGLQGETNILTKNNVSHVVDTFIGLCGVYDIEDHYDYEASRGVHLISPMTPAAEGHANFTACSPTFLARQISHGKSSDLAKYGEVEVISNGRGRRWSKVHYEKNTDYLSPAHTPGRPADSKEIISTESSVSTQQQSEIDESAPSESSPSVPVFPELAELNTFSEELPSNEESRPRAGTLLPQFPYTLLVHGLYDTVVPHTSTEKFARALDDLSVKNRVIYIRSDHVDPLLETIKGNRRPGNMINKALLEALN